MYDIAANTGWVNVGTDADTGQFAVESIRRWWNAMGVSTYHQSTRLLITADSVGTNGSRLRLWKTELAALATETGLPITVYHLPPGTSKWNKIEHRLFSAISRSWRARPLTSHEVVIETIEPQRLPPASPSKLKSTSEPTERASKLVTNKSGNSKTVNCTATSFTETGTTHCIPRHARTHPPKFNAGP